MTMSKVIRIKNHSLREVVAYVCYSRHSHKGTEHLLVINPGMPKIEQTIPFENESEMRAAETMMAREFPKAQNNG